MNFEKLIILTILLKTLNLSSQEKLEIGKHIYRDKLTYITLTENNKFEYLKYYNWSPYIIAKKEGNQNCGTISYISGAKGKGEYELSNGKLILKFLEFQKYMDKQTKFDKKTKTMEFIISEFIN